MSTCLVILWSIAAGRLAWLDLTRYRLPLHWILVLFATAIGLALLRDGDPTAAILAAIFAGLLLFLLEWMARQAGAQGFAGLPDFALMVALGMGHDWIEIPVLIALAGLVALAIGWWRKSRRGGRAPRYAPYGTAAILASLLLLVVRAALQERGLPLSG